MGLLSRRSTTLRLHGLIQKEEQRPRKQRQRHRQTASGQHARLSAVSTLLYLQIRRAGHTVEVFALPHCALARSDAENIFDCSSAPLSCKADRQSFCGREVESSEIPALPIGHSAALAH